VLVIKENTDIFRFVDENGIEAIAHGVNTKGIMGGFAGMISIKYRNQCDGYLEVCKENKASNPMIKCGSVVEAIGEPTIYHCVTQNNPGADADIYYILESLDEAVRLCKVNGYKALAIPAIGCGIGGLSLRAVVHTLGAHFSAEEFPIYLCLQTDAPKLEV